MLSLFTTLLLAQGALASPSAFTFSHGAQQPLTGPPSPPKHPKTPAVYSSIPSSDTIICPPSEAIIPVYGSPDQHHSYITAVYTFCRRDLIHIPHGAPHTTSNKPPTGVLKKLTFSSNRTPDSVYVSPKAPLSRSYRVTLITDQISHDESLSALPPTNPIKLINRRGKPRTVTHIPNNHQLELEIRNNADHLISVSTEDCVASFMAIVDAANGCRVSDALTKPGEYRVGSTNEKGMGGVVFKATQWM